MVYTFRLLRAHTSFCSAAVKRDRYRDQQVVGRVETPVTGAAAVLSHSPFPRQPEEESRKKGLTESSKLFSALKYSISLGFLSFSFSFFVLPVVRPIPPYPASSRNSEPGLVRTTCCTDPGRFILIAKSNSEVPRSYHVDTIEEGKIMKNREREKC